LFELSGPALLGNRPRSISPYTNARTVKQVLITAIPVMRENPMLETCSKHPLT
jgi:hypothetical protein